jgi:hypothetical protein
MIYFGTSIRWKQFTVLARTSCFYIRQHMYTKWQMKKAYAFEVLTLVVMKNTILWDDAMKSDKSQTGICRLHLQG